MNATKKIKIWTQIFYVCKNVNLATFLYAQSPKSLFRRWLYFLLPIVFFAINIFLLIYDKVLYGPKINDKFTYLNDLSNSLCLSLLYFLSYFLSGYYPLKFDEFSKKGMRGNLCSPIHKHSKIQKRITVVIGCILFIVGVASGYLFYDMAKSNADAFWMHNLNSFGRIYYCLFLGTTWYHSLSLLGMSIASGFVVFWALRSGKINYVEDDFTKNISIISAVDIVFSTFSYGLFYIIGAFLVIFNDRLSYKHYKLKNAFYEDIPSFILVFIILFLVVTAFIPLQELFVFMKNKKDALLLKLNNEILNETDKEQKNYLTSKRNDLIKQSLIDASITNKIVFILSVLVPSIGVVFQAIELFSKK